MTERNNQSGKLKQSADDSIGGRGTTYLRKRSGFEKWFFPSIEQNIRFSLFLFIVHVIGEPRASRACYILSCAWKCTNTAMEFADRTIGQAGTGPIAGVYVSDRASFGASNIYKTNWTNKKTLIGWHRLCTNEHKILLGARVRHKSTPQPKKVNVTLQVTW